MNRFEAMIFERLGGIDAAIKWLKGKRSAFYGPLFSKMSAMDLQPPPEPVDSAALRHTIEQALIGVVNARQRGDFNLATRTFEGGPSVDVNSGVTKNVSTRLLADDGANSGITDTTHHGIADTPAPQALPNSPVKTKPDDVMAKPDHRRDKPQRVESIPGLCAGEVLNGSSSQPDYGRNWSQTRYYGS
jgi:hypothetical protein